MGYANNYKSTYANVVCKPCPWNCPTVDIKWSHKGRVFLCSEWLQPILHSSWLSTYCDRTRGPYVQLSDFEWGKTGRLRENIFFPWNQCSCWLKSEYSDANVASLDRRRLDASTWGVWIVHGTMDRNDWHLYQVALADCRATSQTMTWHWRSVTCQMSASSLFYTVCCTEGSLLWLSLNVDHRCWGLKWCQEHKHWCSDWITSCLWTNQGSTYGTMTDEF